MYENPSISLVLWNDCFLRLTMPRLDDSFQCPHHFSCHVAFGTAFCLSILEKNATIPRSPKGWVGGIGKVFASVWLWEAFFFKKYIPPKVLTVRRWKGTESQKEAESSSKHRFFSEALLRL